MRILLVNTLYRPYRFGGAEESVRELAEELAEEGNEVTVATIAPRDSEQPEREEIDGVRVARFRTASADAILADGAGSGVASRLLVHARHLVDPAAARFLGSLVREVDPEVVNTHNIGGIGVAAWGAAAGRPLVHTMRDYFLLCTSVMAYRDGADCLGQCRSCGVLKRPISGSRHRPDHYIGISSAVVELHRGWGALPEGASTEVIPNAPSAPPMPSPDAEPGAETDTERGGRPAGGTLRIGYIGRVRDFKGAWVLLDAFRLLDDPDLRLVIAGAVDEGDAAQLDSRLRADPRIEHLGHVPAGEFYSRVDAVAVPSQWREPFGRVAAEAALLGIPTVLSATGGLTDIAGASAEATLVADYASPAAWAEQLAAVVTSIRAAGTETSEHRTALAPTDATVAERYLASYRRVLDSAG